MIGIGIVLGIILVGVICCVMCVKNYQSRQLNGVKNREVNEMRKLKSQVEKKTKSGKFYAHMYKGPFIGFIMSWIFIISY